MNRIKYDMKLIGFISVFENVTKTKVKDCIAHEDSLIFIVEQNEIGRAIGKNGQNAKMLERLLKKKIRIVEFNPDVGQFVKNIAYPLKVDDVGKENELIIIKCMDRSTKGMLIGRNGSNLRHTEDIVKRHFEIKEIKVV